MYSKVPHTHVRAPRRTGEPPEMETVLNCHLKLQTEELLWGMGSGRGSREARPTRASSTCRLRSGLLGGEPPAVLSHRPLPSAVRGGRGMALTQGGPLTPGHLRPSPAHVCCSSKSAQPLWRTVWRFLKKLEIELPYDPAIPLLGIHTKQTRIERDACTPMFIPALFIIARTWKQPRCPSADEWIRKLWYIYTTEYYSAIEKNTFESVLMRWMKLEPIIQNEVSQKEKHQYSILTHMYGI